MSSSDALTHNDAAYEPYIGLRPFEESERDRFFGRDREINILLDNIRFNRLTLLLAGSGVGKSSLLRAGVMPVLRGDSDTELLYHNVWSGEPAKELKQAIAEHFRKKYRLAPFDEQFVRLPLKDMLRTCTMFSTGQQILLLDQFEEFFNYQRFREGFGDFVEELSAAVRDRGLPASFVFSMREDFALELNAFKEFLPGVFDNYFRLEKLTREQARLAIEKPLERTGYSFAPQQGERKALLDQVLDDLAKREQERQLGVQELLKLKELPLLVEPPHLQIVCRELWLHHRDEQAREITHAAYEKAGRAGGMLESYFIKIISQFSESEQYIASAAFDYLIGSRGVKISQSLDQLADLTFLDKKDLQSVLDILQNNTIIRRKYSNGILEYELYHDIFSEYIHKWNVEFKISQQERKPSYEELVKKLSSLDVDQQKIASGTFKALYARRTAKIRRPLDKLVELTKADEKELQKVLNKLQEYSILRRQKTDNGFSYEIYNDNLLEDISKWNFSFNEASRRRRRICLISTVVVSVCLLFVGNNWWANNYSRYLQLSSEVGISDRIEVYKGIPNSFDLFELGIFLYESPFLRQELEADKRFYRSVVKDRENTQINLLGRLPFLERLSRYGKNGLYRKLDDLAENILENEKEDLVSALPAYFVSVRRTKSVEFLLQLTEKQNGQDAVAALAQLRGNSIAITRLEEDADARQNAEKALGGLETEAGMSKLNRNLKELEKEKEKWRKTRDSQQQVKIWTKERWEYTLGDSLARIAPERRGIDLLNHPLYQVRQGAIRALASRISDGTDGAALIGKIIQAHQKFDPDDLPSPFPYAAFQAIDLSLWNLEYSGKKDDLEKLREILKTVPEKSNIPGQEGAIKERLEWTIKRLGENLARNEQVPAAEKE